MFCRETGSNKIEVIPDAEVLRGAGAKKYFGKARGWWHIPDEVAQRVGPERYYRYKYTWSARVRCMTPYYLDRARVMDEMFRDGRGLREIGERFSLGESAVIENLSGYWRLDESRNS